MKMKNKIKGYKATNMDMTCLNTKFEVGKKYTHESLVIPCESGFHFCKDIYDVFWFYYTDSCRIFEVIGSGDVIHDGVKTICSEIEFVRELDLDDIKQLKNKNILYKSYKRLSEINKVLESGNYTIKWFTKLSSDHQSYVVSKGYLHNEILDIYGDNVLIDYNHTIIADIIRLNKDDPKIINKCIETFTNKFYIHNSIMYALSEILPIDEFIKINNAHISSINCKMLTNVIKRETDLDRIDNSLYYNKINTNLKIEKLLRKLELTNCNNKEIIESLLMYKSLSVDIAISKRVFDLRVLFRLCYHKQFYKAFNMMKLLFKVRK